MTLGFTCWIDNTVLLKKNLWVDFTLLIFSTTIFAFSLFFLACLPISLMCLYTEPFSIHKESIKSSLEKVNMHEKRCWYNSALSHQALWMQAQNVSSNEWQVGAGFPYKKEPIFTPEHLYLQQGRVSMLVQQLAHIWKACYAVTANGIRSRQRDSTVVK